MRASGSNRRTVSRTRSETSAATTGWERDRRSRTAMVSPPCAAWTPSAMPAANIDATSGFIRHLPKERSLTSQGPGGLRETGQLVPGLRRAPPHLLLRNRTEAGAQRRAGRVVQAWAQQHLEDDLVSRRAGASPADRISQRGVEAGIAQKPRDPGAGRPRHLHHPLSVQREHGKDLCPL